MLIASMATALMATVGSQISTTLPAFPVPLRVPDSSTRYYAILPEPPKVTADEPPSDDKGEGKPVKIRPTHGASRRFSFEPV